MLFLTAADFRADHRHSSSSLSWWTGAAGGGGLQGFTPRTEFNSAWRSSARLTFQFPHGRGGRVGSWRLSRFFPGQGSTAFRGADFVDISTSAWWRSSRTWFCCFILALAWCWRVRLSQGFFITFPQIQESARLGPHSGSETGVRTLIHGLRRLMPTPWRSRRTSWTQGRRLESEEGRSD